MKCPICQKALYSKYSGNYECPRYIYNFSHFETNDEKNTWITNEEGTSFNYFNKYLRIYPKEFFGSIEIKDIDIDVFSPDILSKLEMYLFLS